MTSPTDLCHQIQQDPRPEAWSDTLREHAGTCPHCRSFLRTLAALRERLGQLPVATAKLPGRLRERMLNSLNDTTEPRLEVVTGTEAPAAQRPARRRLSLGLLVPAAMAASLALGVVLEKRFDFALPGSTEQLAEAPATMGQYLHDVTHDHYLIERIGRPLEVAITGAGPLSDWLSHALAFDFQLPARAEGLSLEGGRVWHTVGRLSAMASYRTADGAQILLFAVPAENLDLTGTSSEVIHGTRVFSGGSWGHEGRAWIDGDLAVAVTAPDGDLPEGWDRIFLR